MVLALFASAPVWGQASLKTTGFTENFDSMGVDGTWPPDGWTLFTIPGGNGKWTAANGIPVDQMSPEFFGTYSQGLTPVLYPQNAAANNNNGYNAATTNAPNDRALA